MKILIIVLSTFSLLTGCISFNIGPSPSSKAKGVEYKEPSSPFKSMKIENSDRAWISSKTNNTLSFSSECGESTPSIEQIYSELIAGVKSSQVIEEKREFFNDRSSIKTIVAGDLDGVPVKMSFLIFRKNNCSYNINYGGVEKNFDQELSIYNQFLKNFKAP